jgi:hypothetical protein
MFFHYINTYTKRKPAGAGFSITILNPAGGIKEHLYRKSFCILTELESLTYGSREQSKNSPGLV